MLVLDVLGDSITTLKRMCNLTLLAPQPNLAVTRFWPDQIAEGKPVGEHYAGGKTRGSILNPAGASKRSRIPSLSVFR